MRLKGVWVARRTRLKPSGGHYNAGRKQLRDLGLIEGIEQLLVLAGVLAHQVPGLSVAEMHNINTVVDKVCPGACLRGGLMFRRRP